MKHVDALYHHSPVLPTNMTQTYFQAFSFSQRWAWRYRLLCRETAVRYKCANVTEEWNPQENHQPCSVALAHWPTLITEAAASHHKLTPYARTQSHPRNQQSPRASSCYFPIITYRPLHFILPSNTCYHKFNNCQTKCNLFSSLYFCRQLYMFRMLTPIIRSLYNCNYSFWYWLTGSTTIRSRWVPTQQREWMVVDPVNHYQKLYLHLYQLLMVCQHPKHVELPTEI